MSTMSHSILRGKRVGSVSCKTLKASRRALAEARWPPPVSDMRIWMVATSSLAWRLVVAVRCEMRWRRDGRIVGWNAVVAVRRERRQCMMAADSRIMLMMSETLICTIVEVKREARWRESFGVKNYLPEKTLEVKIHRSDK